MTPLLPILIVLSMLLPQVKPHTRCPCRYQLQTLNQKVDALQNQVTGLEARIQYLDALSHRH